MIKSAVTPVNGGERGIRTLDRFQRLYSLSRFIFCFYNSEKPLKSGIIISKSLSNFPIFLFIFAFSCTNLSHAEMITGTPRIIDGDTIAIGDQKIRLYGIDSPEKKQMCGAVKCGEMSKQFLHGLIGENTVVCHWHKKDRYKRILGVCMVNEVNINRIIVRAGYAINYNRYSTAYLPDQHHAKINGFGIWQWGFITPEDYRKTKRKR